MTITVPELTLFNLSKTQKKLVIALSRRPSLTKQLIKIGGVSNVSQMLKSEGITKILAEAGLMVSVSKITREFLWQLSYIPQQQSQQKQIEVTPESIPDKVGRINQADLTVNQVSILQQLANHQNGLSSVQIKTLCGGNISDETVNPTKFKALLEQHGLKIRAHKVNEEWIYTLVDIEEVTAETRE